MPEPKKYFVTYGSCWALKFLGARPARMEHGFPQLGHGELAAICADCGIVFAWKAQPGWNLHHDGSDPVADKSKRG